MPKIWSPVILAQLDPPRTLTLERYYHLKRPYKSIEDLRVKVNRSEATSHGKHVESLVRLNILALMQDLKREPDLLSFNDIFKEWLPIDCFDPPAPLQLDTAMIIEVDKIFCEGDLEGQSLRVQMHINYTILAVQNEAIELSEALEEERPFFPDPEPYYPGQAILETIRNLEYEVQRLAQDNAALNHRIILYEKNLGSMKNALRKAENRSHELFGELLQSRRSREALQEKLEKRENFNTKRPSALPSHTMPTPDPGRFHLGDKIRQLFAMG